MDSNFSTGGFGFYMDSLTVNQFNISNAGADVENAWAGNTIVMDIKTGGNDVSALLYADYLGEGFVGDNLTSELEKPGRGHEPHDHLLGGARRRGRAPLEGQGLVLPRLQQQPDPPGDLRPRPPR